VGNIVGVLTLAGALAALATYFWVQQARLGRARGASRIIALAMFVLAGTAAVDGGWSIRQYAAGLYGEATPRVDTALYAAYLIGLALVAYGLVRWIPMLRSLDEEVRRRTRAGYTTVEYGAFVSYRWQLFDWASYCDEIVYDGSEVFEFDGSTFDDVFFDNSIADDDGDVRGLIERESLQVRAADTFAVHVVLPDRTLDRQPWIEIRTVWGVEDVIDQIEETWPDVEFEGISVDEEDL